MIPHPNGITSAFSRILSSEVIISPSRKQLYGRAIMTNSQKSQIIEFRKKGLGYKTIAAILEITKDSVSGFCRRTGMNGEVSERGKKNNICQSCGRVIPESIIDRKKRFCSNKCRMTWWNKHRKTKPAICECCGKTYNAYTDTRFCSHECYVLYRFRGVRPCKSNTSLESEKT